MNKISSLFVLLAFGLVGCFTPPGGSSAPVNFYRLDYAPAGSEDGPVGVKNTNKILVKVSSSPLLKGPRMLQVSGDYEVNYAEGRRWAEPINAAFTRIIVMGLREDFATVEGVPVPNHFRPDYRISVTVDKLWGTSKGEIVMGVRWQIADARDNVLAESQKEIRKGGWRTGDYRQFAERVSGLMPDLVEAIKASLSSLDQSQKKS